MDANQENTKIESVVLDGQVVKVDDRKIADVMTMVDLACRVVTESNYQAQLSLFVKQFGNYGFMNLQGAIKEFLSHEGSSLATKRIRKYALLKYFKVLLASMPLERASITQYINDLPIEKKVTLALRDEQALTLDQVNFVKKVKLTLKQRAVFFGLVETGLRASELIGIKLSDIKPSIHSNLTSEVRVLGKGSKERFVYLNNEIISMAREAYQGSTYLYEGKNGKPINYQTLHATVEAIGKKVGIPLHPHMLRHTFATLAVKSGRKSIKAISNYLGHASTAITQDVYIHDNFSAKDFEEI